MAGIDQSQRGAYLGAVVEAVGRSCDQLALRPSTVAVSHFLSASGRPTPIRVTVTMRGGDPAQAVALLDLIAATTSASIVWLRRDSDVTAARLPGVLNLQGASDALTLEVVHGSVAVAPVTISRRHLGLADPDVDEHIADRVAELDVAREAVRTDG